LPDAFRLPLVSTVPALLVAGTFDGRTPPLNVTDAAKGLANAQVLFIPRASHGLFGEPAAMAAAVDFFTRLK
jgi:pimeloyl-ACP methyl ester carboxylesterase